MEAETVQRLAVALDRELEEALDTVAFLAERLPDLVRPRRREIEAVLRSLSADARPLGPA